MEAYQVFEFSSVLDQISAYTACSLGREALAEEQVDFSFLKIDKSIKRMKEMLEIQVHYGGLPFGGVSDIRHALKKASMDAILTPYELVSVANHSDAVTSLVRYVRALERTYPFLNDLIESLEPHQSVATAIRPCFTSSNEVADSASPALRNIRRQIAKCNASIASTLEKFIGTHASKLMDTVIASRNDRSVVYVKIAEKNSIRGIIHGESTSGQTAYVEPEALIPLNNELQTLKSAEADEIERILFELSQLVKQVASAFKANVETLALLDAMNAKAAWGKKQNACIPEFTKHNNRFYLKQARHPLIDPAKVVSNTIDLQEGKRILLITGPNTGGKTVNLKVIGLFTLLTYLAIPLPCEEAIVGLYDNIYTDIGDDQSILQSLSTFSAHLTKLAHICDHATKNSLILIDEFGSGTDPKEGESLAIAILNHLRRLKSTVVATTHYGRLKSYGLKHDDIVMAQVEFDIEQMMPTYRFLQGSTGQSNALEIARRFGLRDGIVRDAIHIKQSAMSEEEQMTAKLEQLIQENEIRKTELDQELEDQRIKNRALAAKLQKLEHEQQQLSLEAQAKINAYVEEKMLEAELILEELKESGKTQKMHETVALKTQLKQMVKEEDLLGQGTGKPHKEIEVGDMVEIIGLNKVGEVISLDKKEAYILCHGTKIKVKLKQLKHSHKKAEKPKPKERTTFMKSATVTMECNLIGMRVDEALIEMDKYLDDMLLANVPTVRIIHGVGTGALRSAIHDRLKRLSYVESYRLGQQGEGGVGATVVTFKSATK